MSPELRHLRYFVAVAEELNYSRAAQRLHVAQPALSTAIRQLETELGVQLLERTTRSVSLTAAGELLLVRAQATLALADDTFAMARDAGRGLVGRLRVGLSPLARHGPFESILGLFAGSRPGVALHRHEEPTEALIGGIAARNLDLAICWCALPRGGVALEALRDEPLVVYVAEEHPLARRGAVALEELAGETILVGSPGGSDGFTRALGELFEKEGLSPRFLPDPYPDAGMLAATEGRAIVVGAPTGLDESIKGLTSLALDPLRTLPFSLAWRDGDENPALDVFLGLARRVRDNENWLSSPIAQGDQ